MGRTCRRLQIPKRVKNTGCRRRLRSVGLPRKGPNIIRMFEGASPALSLGTARRVCDGAITENRIGNIRAVAFVGAGSSGINLADSGVEAVVGERIGRRARIRNASDPVFVVVA